MLSTAQTVDCTESNLLDSVLILYDLLDCILLLPSYSSLETVFVLEQQLDSMRFIYVVDFDRLSLPKAGSDLTPTASATKTRRPMARTTPTKNPRTAP